MSEEFIPDSSVSILKRLFINQYQLPSYFGKFITPEEIEINKYRFEKELDDDFKENRYKIKDSIDIFWNNLRERSPELVEYIEKYSASDIYINRSLSIMLKEYKTEGDFYE